MSHATSIRYLLIGLIAITFSAMAAQPADTPQKSTDHNHPNPLPAKPSSASQEKDAAKRSEKPKKLYKFTVQGHRLSPICNLEVIKLALKRPFTINPAHANDIVCRVITLTGTHIKANAHLFCSRIGTVIKNQRKYSGGLSFAVLQMDLKLPEVNRAKFRAKLHQLPDTLSRTCFEPNS